MNGTFVIAVVVVLALALGAYLEIRFFRNVSMRAKLVLTFVPVLLLSVALLGYLTDRDLGHALTQAANQSLLTAASESANRLDNFFITSLDAMRTEEAQLPDFVALLDPEYFRPDFGNQVEILQSLQRKDVEHILSYGLLNTNGLNISDTDSRLFGKDESDETYFKVPLESGYPYISPVLFEEDRNIFVLSTPIYGVNDDIVGVLRVQYSAQILQDLIVESTGKAGPGSFAVLFDENHLHLAHGDETVAPLVNYKLLVPPSNTEWLKQMQDVKRVPLGTAEEVSVNLPELETNLRNSLTQPFFTAQDIATGDKINQVAVTRLESQPWLVAFFQPRDIFLTPITAQRRRSLMLTVLVGVGALAAAVWLGRILAAPIVRLTAVAEQVAEGRLDVLAPVEGRDEISQLARVFNNMTAQLRQLIGSLEEQVEARTKELSLSMLVGQRAAAIREEEKLLSIITQFIRDQFNLYYVQVYYLDDIGQNLILRQGTGDVGQALLEQHHRLPVGAGSIVGQVAATAESIVVPNTELSDIHKPNPLLPATRSELAVPLIVEGNVIGVLDMQGSEPHTFTKKNVTVFEAMATQLAGAIDGSRQWAAAQIAQQRAERALRQLTRETWEDVLRERNRLQQGVGFTYNLSGVIPVRDNTTPPGADTVVTVPLMVQNQQIGQLSLVLADGQQAEDARVILSAVAQQLAQKVENLRLFQDTQRNAWRDQIVSEVTSSIWSSAEVEDVMKAAVAELGEKLNASDVVIRLGEDVAWLSAIDNLNVSSDAENGASENAGNTPAKRR